MIYIYIYIWLVVSNIFYICSMIYICNYNHIHAVIIKPIELVGCTYPFGYIVNIAI